jgi:membrane protein
VQSPASCSAASRGPSGREVNERDHRARALVAAFYRKAYEDNITGQSAMVAYNLLLSVFPLALLALFIAGRVLQSHELERSVLDDLRQLFPSATDDTLTHALHRVRDSSTSFGVIALVSSIWIGSSFWGAMDTAFCRIYHVRCRGWVEQKRFALAMLLVVLLLMAATVTVPTLQSLLLSSAHDLPFGLSKVGGVVYGLSLGGGLVLLFAVLCIIYSTVPNRLVPWRAVWPGAAAATLAIAIVDYGFPAYLGNISTIARVGTTFVFVLIVLIWFYVLAIILLGGGIVNAMRFELEETGQITGDSG